MSSYTIGEDVRAQIIGPYGPITAPQQTVISISPNQTVQVFQDLTGTTNSRTVVRGVSGKITFTRTNPDLETLAAQMSQNWKAGVPIPGGSFTYTISELNGTETTVHLSPVSWMITKIGDAMPGKPVMQELSFVGDGYQTV
jgi:hypothetical protein